MPILQTFEHQSISIGQSGFQQKHFDYLARFAPSKYFQLQHRSIRFKNYVGVLQIGDLTIEILPKIDQQKEDSALWRDFLLDMLRYCRLLKLEEVGTAQLSLKRNSILDIYYELFLEEVEKILHRGIFQQYNSIKANEKSLKGSLQFAEHLRYNWLHKERFFTKHQVYHHNNIFNQIIAAALQLLEQSPLNADLKIKLQQLKTQFPFFPNPIIQDTDFEQLRFNRQNQHYRNAIQIAHLLLLQNRPSLKAGDRQLLALLFDMNLLFEEYIFRQLCKCRNAGIQVSRQERKAFWNRQYIRPDIVVQNGDKRYIIDTKWKMLRTAKPSMSDLQQAFVYGQYFDAKTSILLYPQHRKLQNLAPQSFELEGDYRCGLYFAKVLKNNKLNLEIGQEIVDFLDLQ
ncbi:MAG: restriction endonuclease [Bacteroidota bacterium]